LTGGKKGDSGGRNRRRHHKGGVKKKNRIVRMSKAGESGGSLREGKTGKEVDLL